MEASRLQAGRISSSARALAATVDVRATASRVADDILAEVWPAAGVPDFDDALRRSVEGNISAIFDVMLERIELGDTRPRQALEFADVAAELDLPEAELERAYRVGATSMWTQWLALATAYADDEGLPLADFIDGPSLTIMGYVDHIMGAVTGRYEARRAELAQTQRHTRRLLVTDLIEGALDLGVRDLDARLGYHLADTHLALLVHPVAGELDEHAMQRVRVAADARATLVHQQGPESWVIWLGRPGGYDRRTLTAVRRALDAVEGVIAVGEPGAGLEGMRRTRVQAIDTARVQQALGDRIVWAPDVRLEALLLAHPLRAATFVGEELGRLAEQDTLAVRLRETLLAFLATASYVGAAATLGVHENTIRNRIRQAEELLGAPLNLRRTELQVALRLERVLRAEAVQRP